MRVYGYPINYDGSFGDLPVVQAGRFKVIAIRDYPSVPLVLGVHMVKAKQAGAQFLIVDPDPVRVSRPQFMDVRVAA